MTTWNELRYQLGVALNEAGLLGFEVDPVRRVAGATFRVLTLPEKDPPPEDRRVQVVFHPAGRLVASLRQGHWNDPSAGVIPFDLPELLSVIQSFEGQPIYGWKFFDIHERELAQWGDRLSLEWRSGVDGLSRSITLFQESACGPTRHLDLCVWFDELEVRRPDGTALSLAEFAAGGKRWWDALHAGDKRTDGHGIVPGGPDTGVS